MARIFLCHANDDKAPVREVYQQLKALGFAPWLDEVDILPGQDWDYEIEQALETSDFVMVFLSTRSVKKIGYVQRELKRGLYHSEEMPEGFIHTIPVKLDDCAVPRLFKRHQWVNLYESGAFDRIVHALHHGLQQRDQPLPEPLTHDPSSARPETAPPSILQAPPHTSRPEAPAPRRNAPSQPTSTKQDLSAEDYFNMAHELSVRFYFDRAIAYYTSAIELNPQYAEAYFARAGARRANDKGGAIADYTEAIRLNPQYAEAYFARGGVRDKQGDRARGSWRTTRKPSGSIRSMQKPTSHGLMPAGS